MADLDLDAIAAIETEWDGYADDAWVTLTVPERDALVAEVRRLRALLARCVDHIDPNDSDDAYRLLVECEEASRG